MRKAHQDRMPVLPGKGTYTGTNRERGETGLGLCLPVAQGVQGFTVALFGQFL